MENYFRVPDRDMPWNVRLLLCGLFLQVMSLALVIALLASLGGVVQHVSELMPEVGDTLDDMRKIVPEMGDTMKDVQFIMPEIRRGLDILNIWCKKTNCTLV